MSFCRRRLEEATHLFYLQPGEENGWHFRPIAQRGSPYDSKAATSFPVDCRLPRPGPRPRGRPDHGALLEPGCHSGPSPRPGGIGSIRAFGTSIATWLNSLYNKHLHQLDLGSFGIFQGSGTSGFPELKHAAPIPWPGTRTPPGSVFPPRAWIPIIRIAKGGIPRIRHHIFGIWNGMCKKSFQIALSDHPAFPVLPARPDAQDAVVDLVEDFAKLLGQA